MFSLEPRGALIDIGAKTAAYLPYSGNVDQSGLIILRKYCGLTKPESFFILTDENEDGQLTLSIRRIEYMRAWERVRQLQQEDATVRSSVFATNRGGALVRMKDYGALFPVPTLVPVNRRKTW